MQILNVELGTRSYPIYIGRGLLEDAGVWQKHLAEYEQILIVTNDTIDKIYLQKVREKIGRAVKAVILPDGEKYKTLDSIGLIITGLLEANYTRKCLLVALGGGVIGDMTGFAASCYQRGVDFIQIPTTLLAQVDSSVGGKTGVNHPLGKNMIGTFYQPKCVVIDIGTLDTLPEREYRAGLAEIIKYGLIMDESFFSWLEENVAKLLNRDNEAVSYAIEKSCALKSEVVAEDEREGGLRAILNLGHTFGHAIEAAQDYRGLLHGEAVAIGMWVAAVASMLLGKIGRNQVARIGQLITAAGLRVDIPMELSNDQLLGYMQKDKKNLTKAIRLVLLDRIGRACIQETARENIAGALASAREMAKGI